MTGVGSEPREGYRAGNGAITGNQVLIRTSNLDVFYLTKPTLTRLLLCCHTSFPMQSSLEILFLKKKKKKALLAKQSVILQLVFFHSLQASLLRGFFTSRFSLDAGRRNPNTLISTHVPDGAFTCYVLPSPRSIFWKQPSCWELDISYLTSNTARLVNLHLPFELLA